MSGRLRFVLFLTLILVAAIQETQAEPLQIRLRENYTFSVQFRDDFSIKKQEAGDFDLYTLLVGSEAYLGFYVGNHPNYPHEKGRGEGYSEMDLCLHSLNSEEVFLRMSGESVSDLKISSWRKNGKLVHKELLAYILTDQKQIPLYVHACIMPSLSDDQVQVADEILSSLRISVGSRN